MINESSESFVNHPEPKDTNPSPGRVFMRTLAGGGIAVSLIGIGIEIGNIVHDTYGTEAKALTATFIGGLVCSLTVFNKK